MSKPTHHPPPTHRHTPLDPERDSSRRKLEALVRAQSRECVCVCVLCVCVCVGVFVLCVCVRCRSFIRSFARWLFVCWCVGVCVFWGSGRVAEVPTQVQTYQRAGHTGAYTYGSGWASAMELMWLWVTNAYPKWNPEKWNQRLNLRSPGGSILTHTHVTTTRTVQRHRLDATRRIVGLHVLLVPTRLAGHLKTTAPHRSCSGQKGAPCFETNPVTTSIKQSFSECQSNAASVIVIGADTS